MKHNKIAIVYDWIDSWGGAERVLQTFADMFPDADWYTLVYSKEKAPWSHTLSLNTSFINIFPSFIKKTRALCVPFMPFAVESFNLSPYTHVISITSAFSKAVITRPETRHISYILSPPRFLWTHQEEYGTLSGLLRPYVNYLKTWDKIAAQRPDKLIAVSKDVKERIQNIYKLDAEVIYPPFDYAYWADFVEDRPHKESYLVVSRLEQYKMINIVLEVFKKLPDKKLTIVGEGSLYKKLQSMATKNITFTKNLSDKELAAHYASAKALIMAQREDFGYVALEAQACGCPVLAYNFGGAAETVIHQQTGMLFDAQSPQGLIKAIEKYEAMEYTIRRSSQKISREHLHTFSKEIFRKKFITLLTSPHL